MHIPLRTGGCWDEALRSGDVVGKASGSPNDCKGWTVGTGLERMRKVKEFVNLVRSQKRTRQIDSTFAVL